MKVLSKNHAAVEAEKQGDDQNAQGHSTSCVLRLETYALKPGVSMFITGPCAVRSPAGGS